VAVARALVNAPDLLFADEPTASLETSQGLRLIETLSEYVHAHEAGLMVATHDLRLTAYADRVLRIEDGVLTLADEFRLSPAIRTNQIV
jgi:putative ABC transport system ATP-binding protein